MQESDDRAVVASALLAFGRTVPTEKLFPARSPQAVRFVLGDAYAFALAVCLDRQTPVETIWTIPYDLRTELGHLDPWRIRALTLDELGQIFSRLARRPRFVNDAPLTVADLTAIVCDECDGDASRLWTGKSAGDIKQSFLRIYGVGEGIANMAVLLIEKAFGVRFADVDRPRMDVKPDQHVRRVLYRLGASRSETAPDAVMAARQLRQSFPGELDAPLWVIGREFCHSTAPDCLTCPVVGVCRRVGLTTINQASQPIRAMSSPDPAPGPLLADDLDRMRRSLLRLLDHLDSSPAGGHERQGARIGRLTDDGTIPREIAAMMRSVTEARNVVVYESRELSELHTSALRATWRAIVAWAAGRGVTLVESG